MNKRYLLAYDLSTVTIGYTVFDIDTKEIVEIDYKKMNGDDLINKGNVIDELNKFLYNKYKFETFVIEDSLKSFSSGGTNSNAMLKTTSLNFLCQFLMMDRFKIQTNGLNVNHARGLFEPLFHKMIRKMKGVKGKDLMFEMVKKQYPEIKFPTKILKSGNRKGVEVFLEEAKDMSDSLVLGKAWLIENMK